MSNDASEQRQQQQQQQQQQHNAIIPHDGIIVEEEQHQEEEDVLDRMFGWAADQMACPLTLCDDYIGGGTTKLTKGDTNSGVTPPITTTTNTTTTTTPQGVLDYVCDVHIFAPTIETTLYSICCCGSVDDVMVLNGGENINISKTAKDALIPNEYEDRWLVSKIEESTTTGWKVSSSNKTKTNNNKSDDKFSHNYLLEVGHGGSTWHFYPITEDNLKAHNQINPAPSIASVSNSTTNVKQEEEEDSKSFDDKVTTKVEIDVVPDIVEQHSSQSLPLTPPDGEDTDVSSETTSSSTNDEVSSAIFSLGLEFEEDASVVIGAEKAGDDNIDDEDDDGARSGTGTLSTVSIEGKNESEGSNAKNVEQTKVEATSKSSSSSTPDGEGKDGSGFTTEDHNDEEATSSKTSAEEVHEMISTTLSSTWNRFMGSIVQPMLWNSVDTDDSNSDSDRKDEDTCRRGNGDDGEEEEEILETRTIGGKTKGVKEGEGAIATQDQILAIKPEDVLGASQDNLLPATSVEQRDGDKHTNAVASRGTALNLMVKKSHNDDDEEEEEAAITTNDHGSSVPTTIAGQTEEEKHALYASVATSMKLKWGVAHTEEEDENPAIPTAVVEQATDEKGALYSSVAASMKLKYPSTKPFHPNEKETTTTHMPNSFHSDDVDREICESSERMHIPAEHAHHSDEVASNVDSWSTLSPFIEDCDSECDINHEDSSSGVLDNSPLEFPPNVISVDKSPAIASRAVPGSSAISLSDDEKWASGGDTQETAEEVVEKPCVMSTRDDVNYINSTEAASANDADDWGTANSTGILLVPIQESPSVKNVGTEESTSALPCSKLDFDLFGETSANYNVLKDETTPMYSSIVGIQKSPVDSTVRVEEPPDSSDNDLVSEKLTNSRARTEDTMLARGNPPVPILEVSPSVSADCDSTSEASISCKVMDDPPMVAKSLAMSMGDGSISKASNSRAENVDNDLTTHTQPPVSIVSGEGLAHVVAGADSPALSTNGDSCCDSSNVSESSHDRSIPISVSSAPNAVDGEEAEPSTLSNRDTIEDDTPSPATDDGGFIPVKLIDIGAKMNVLAESDQPKVTPEHTPVVPVSEATESNNDDSTISEASTSSEASQGESMSVHETSGGCDNIYRAPFASSLENMSAKAISTPSTTMVHDESSSESDDSYEDYDNYGDNDLVAIFDSLVDYSARPLSPSTRPLSPHYDDIIAEALSPSSMAGGGESNQKPPGRGNYFYYSDFLDVPEAPVYSSVAVAMKIRLPSPF